MKAIAVTPLLLMSGLLQAIPYPEQMECENGDSRRLNHYYCRGKKNAQPFLDSFTSELTPIRNKVYFMHQFRLCIYLFLLGINIPVGQAAVFGKDNRMGIDKVANQQVRQLSRSIAAMIPMSNFAPVDADHYVVKAETLTDRNVLCPQERFTQLIAPAECSGFLIANDTLLTAGHCLIDFSPISSTRDKLDVRWIFNFHSDKQVFHHSELLKGKVVKLRYGNYVNVDFAVIKFAKPVENIAPLSLRSDGAPLIDDLVFMLGHPSGLPMVYTNNGNIIEMVEDMFTVDLDGFKGNSGSPVFNQTTGLVEGIYVRGNPDDYQFDWDLEDPCTQVVKCTKDDCRLGDVVRINKIDFVTLTEETQF